MTKSEIQASAGGGMFVVIPSVVMRDPALSLSAKMLYGVITWKCNESSCCWATNRTLGDELGLSPKRVSALLSTLERQGHIELEIIRDPESNQITRRNIYPMVKSARPILKDGDTPILKNEDTSPHFQGEPIPENAEEKYKKEIEKEINTPLTPQRGEARTARKSKYDLAEDAKPMLRAYVGEDRELARLLGDFIDSRKSLTCINSKRAISIQLKRLDELSGGDRAKKLSLLECAIGSSWRAIYPERGGRPAPVEPERMELVQGPGVYDL